MIFQSTTTRICAFVSTVTAWLSSTAPAKTTPLNAILTTTRHPTPDNPCHLYVILPKSPSQPPPIRRLSWLIMMATGNHNHKYNHNHNHPQPQSTNPLYLPQVAAVFSLLTSKLPSTSWAAAPSTCRTSSSDSATSPSSSYPASSVLFVLSFDKDSPTFWHTRALWNVAKRKGTLPHLHSHEYSNSHSHSTPSGRGGSLFGYARCHPSILSSVTK